MPAHQCPRCPLRFSFRTEVEWHLANDHRPVRTDPKHDAAAKEPSADPRAVPAGAPAAR